jgi:hypothetical protein
MVQLFPGQKEYACNACGSELFKAHISTGYLYILSNPSMPNLLKIGFTERDVEERVEELNSTGVPVPFEIEAIFGSPNAYEDEQEIHNTLKQHRLANNREFFSIDLKQAIQCVFECIGSEPSFLKNPELLMDEQEKENYRLLVEISELEDIRNEYINLVPELKWNEWVGFIQSKSERRSFDSEDMKNIYERSLINTLLVDQFTSTPETRENMLNCLNRLEELLQSKGK